MSESECRGAGVFQGLNSQLKGPKSGTSIPTGYSILCELSREHLSNFVGLSGHSFEILFWYSRCLLQLVPKNMVFLSFFYVTERTTER